MGGWFRVSPPLSKHDQQDCAVKEENPCSLSTCVFVFRVSVLLLGAKWKFWWNMKTFIFSQFQTLRPCEAVSDPHWRAFAAMENCKKNWQAKLLLRSNKAARHCQNHSRALQHTLLFSSPKVLLCKWSLNGRLVLRPPAETVVGVQGGTWVKVNQGNSFLPPSSICTRRALK